MWKAFQRFKKKLFINNEFITLRASSGHKKPAKIKVRGISICVTQQKKDTSVMSHKLKVKEKQTISYM